MNNLARFAALTLVLLWLPQAQAGVYRCKNPNGTTYFSDKGCEAGDPAGKPSGKGNMTYLGGNPAKGGPATPGVKYGPRSYVQRAETGANRAEQKLGTQKK